MSIASELQNYADGLDDAWDAAEDMGATIPHDRNMVNLDDAIRTIPVSSPNDGVLTITQNGTTIQTFSADQATNVTAALTDTTYSDFTGATSSVAGANGLVPAPSAGDQDKYLKADGTWSTVQSGGVQSKIFYGDIGYDGAGISLYHDSQLTQAITSQEWGDATEDPNLNLWVYNVDGDYLCAMVNSTGNIATFSDYPGTSFFVVRPDSSSTFDFRYYNLQEGLTAGSNISISANNTISATDTTYSDFTGATSSVAGVAGLVPAPTTADPDKYLKGDGSWGTPTDTTYTAGTNVQISAQNVISATDTTYSDFTGATSSVAGSAGLVPAPTTSDSGKFLKGDGTWGKPDAELVEMYYGESNAWAKFIDAYTRKCIVYCRASSNSNPGSGAKTRKAFMAYVNNEDNPTNVEFQYVRSQSSKTDSQQTDQVFVYTLTNSNGGTWSVASRNMGPKINVSGPITKTFTSGANATITIGADAMTGATASADGAAGIVPKPVTGDQDKVLTGAGTWAKIEAGAGISITYNNGTYTISLA